MTGTVVAVDLGATSGRVMLGHVGADELRLLQVARFPNGPVPRDGGLHWDISALRRGALDGIAASLRAEPDATSVGIDAWAVDYGLLRNGALLGEPFHYRDERTHAGVTAVHDLVPDHELYAANGLQHLAFSTLYQLATEPDLATAETMLLIPDLFGFWLTGRVAAERTNASTTGLLDVATREWNWALIERLRLPRALFPEIIDAGTTVGTLSPDAALQLGASSRLSVTAVGSHDTASAVVAVPATDDEFAYISCGTWALVGVELDSAVITDAGRAANFTNELGVDGTVRYLRNVMGLWLVNECVREWQGVDATIDVATLLSAAEAIRHPVPVFDPDDPSFLPPGDMPARIADWLTRHGQAVPASPAEFVRTIIESLAAAFVRTAAEAASLTGKHVAAIHVVGGGSQIALLCQRTADLSGLPVLAGPVEATAIGNVLVQARTAGFATGSLASLRQLVAAAFPPRRYTPTA